VDLTVAANAVAGPQALGAGGGLMAGIIEPMHAVFGPAARSVDALEQTRRDGAQVAVTELASALAWHAGVTPQLPAGPDAYPAGQGRAVVGCRTSCE
jgi:hypothetical protein